MSTAESTGRKREREDAQRTVEQLLADPALDLELEEKEFEEYARILRKNKYATEAKITTLTVSEMHEIGIAFGDAKQIYAFLHDEAAAMDEKKAKVEQPYRGPTPIEATPAAESLTSRAGSHDTGEMLTVLDSQLKSTMQIPMCAAVHVPTSTMRLALCPFYDVRNANSCASGMDCKFVHANLDIGRRGLPFRSGTHVNYAYRSLDDVKYPRLKAGDRIRVMQCNNTLPPELIPSERIIVTKAARERINVSTVSHCTHYFYEAECFHGDECNYIHAVHINPAAQPGQRAPTDPPPTIETLHRATASAPYGRSLPYAALGFRPTTMNPSTVGMQPLY